MRKIALGVAAAVAIVSTPALAGQATGTVQVSLNVSSSCSVSTQPLDFGTTDSFTTSNDAISATTVKCTPLAEYEVLVDYGTNASGTQRRLKSAAGGFVNYALFTDAGRTQPWTPLAGATGTGDGSEKQTPIYGRIPSQDAVAAGDYKDTLTVTVNY
jgi:spore coat protein U-like protein